MGPEVRPEGPEVRHQVRPEVRPEVQPEVRPEMAPEVRPEVMPKVMSEVVPEIDDSSQVRCAVPMALGVCHDLCILFFYIH